MPSFLYAVESAGNTAAYHLGKFMEREYKAESFLVQAHRPFEIDEETFRSPIGSVSLRHAAVQSGLAVWGKNTLALTREYGPRVMFLGLLNSLDLESDPPMKGYDPCSTCQYDCRSTCPGKAFTEEGRVLSHRCVKVSQPDDVGNFMRFLMEIGTETFHERTAGDDQDLPVFSVTCSIYSFLSTTTVITASILPWRSRRPS